MKGYEFPNHPTPVKITDTVCVIGAGNVSMDCARTAKRLGAKNVYIVYQPYVIKKFQLVLKKYIMLKKKALFLNY